MRKMRSIAEHRTIERLTGYKAGTIGAEIGIQRQSGYKPGTIGGERYIQKQTAQGDNRRKRDFGTH